MPKRFIRSILSALIATIVLVVLAVSIIQWQNVDNMMRTIEAYDREAIALSKEIPNYYENPQKRVYLDYSVTDLEMRNLNDRINSLVIGYTGLKQYSQTEETYEHVQNHVNQALDRFNQLNHKYQAQLALNRYYEGSLIRGSSINKNTLLADQVSIEQLRLYPDIYLSHIENKDAWYQEMEDLYWYTYREANQVRGIEIAIEDFFEEDGSVKENLYREWYNRVVLDIFTIPNEKTQTRLLEKIAPVSATLKVYDPIMEDLNNQVLKERTLFTYLREVSNDPRFSSVAEAAPWYYMILHRTDRYPYEATIFSSDMSGEVYSVEDITINQSGQANFNRANKSINIINQVSYKQVKALEGTWPESLNELNQHRVEQFDLAKDQALVGLHTNRKFQMPIGNQLRKSELVSLQVVEKNENQTHYQVVSVFDRNYLTIYDVQMTDQGILESNLSGPSLGKLSEGLTLDPNRVIVSQRRYHDLEQFQRGYPANPIYYQSAYSSQMFNWNDISLAVTYDKDEASFQTYRLGESWEAEFPVLVDKVESKKVSELVQKTNP